MVRRRPGWGYVIATLVVLYLVAGAVGAVVAGHVARGPAGAAANLALHGTGLAAAYLVLRRELAPTRAALLLGATAVAGLASNLVSEYTGVGLLFVVAWLAPFRTRLWVAVASTVATAGAFVVLSLAAGLPGDAVAGIAAGLGWALFLAGALSQIAATRRQAAAVAAARAGEAMLAERQRMAREIHDVLAHSLSAQVVYLEGSRMLLERGGDPSRTVREALERVVRAGEMARAGLEETKRAVAALRGEDGPLVDQLAELVTAFRGTTGNPCAVEVTGDPDRLAPAARLAVVHTTREALTNVHKHAPRASVTIAVRCAGNPCELDIRDTGGHAGELADTGSGYGLIGMRERAELIGGTLDAGPEGAGFRVLLRIPA